MNAAHYRTVMATDKAPVKCIHGVQLGQKQPCPHCGLKAGLPRLLWASMDSAPQGVGVIVSANGETGEAADYGEGWKWASGGSIEPDGWMPLPPPLSEEAKHGN